MTLRRRPLVLVHGLFDDPSVFCHLVKGIDEFDLPLLIPHLEHQLGRISLRTLAQKLDSQILGRWGPDISIDLLGFSLGGVISRVWLQELGGARRTNRFISVGCPHSGTLTAQIVPSWLLAGVSEMKRGSRLLNELNSDMSSLKGVACSSYFCRWDLMVFPGWQAVLPIGLFQEVPVCTHKELMSHPKSLKILLEVILSDRSYKA